MHIGRIAAIHRYPVKSMLGESLDAVTLGTAGIPGDRGWAVRDEVRGGIRGGKKLPGLMGFAARNTTEPLAGSSPPAEITPPEGAPFLTTDPDVSQRLSKALGHEVSLWPLQPAEDLDHYRRGAPDDADFMQELRAIFGRLPDEPLPDLGAFPPELLQYESPPGTYFDAYPLLLLTDASLATLQRGAPGQRFDVRRFRPNLVLESLTGDARFPEDAWAGRTLAIGNARLRVEMRCPRCVMTTHGFADVPHDPGIMRRLVRENGGNLGAYASVTEPGRIAVGDAVRLEAD